MDIEDLRALRERARREAELAQAAGGDPLASFDRTLEAAFDEMLDLEEAMLDMEFALAEDGVELRAGEDLFAEALTLDEEVQARKRLRARIAAGHCRPDGQGADG